MSRPEGRPPTATEVRLAHENIGAATDIRKRVLHHFTGIDRARDTGERQLIKDERGTHIVTIRTGDMIHDDVSGIHLRPTVRTASTNGRLDARHISYVNPKGSGGWEEYSLSGEISGRRAELIIIDSAEQPPEIRVFISPQNRPLSILKPDEVAEINQTFDTRLVAPTS
jgi:hypothetical protein